MASGALSIWCISSIETEEARFDHSWKGMGSRYFPSVFSYFMGECRKHEARLSWRCTVLGRKAVVTRESPGRHHENIFHCEHYQCPWLYSELGWTRLWAKLEPLWAEIHWFGPSATVLSILQDHLLSGGDSLCIKGL